MTYVPGHHTYLDLGEKEEEQLFATGASRFWKADVNLTDLVRNRSHQRPQFCRPSPTTQTMPGNNGTWYTVTSSFAFEIEGEATVAMVQLSQTSAEGHSSTILLSYNEVSTLVLYLETFYNRYRLFKEAGDSGPMYWLSDIPWSLPAGRAWCIAGYAAQARTAVATALRGEEWYIEISTTFVTRYKRPPMKRFEWSTSIFIEATHLEVYRDMLHGTVVTHENITSASPGSNRIQKELETAYLAVDETQRVQFNF